METWKDFAEIITEGNLCPATYIYRGQANSEWLIESTLDRLEKIYSKTPNLVGGVPKEGFNHPPVNRELQLERFKEMSRGKLPNPPDDNEENEWWAIAQHFGLATPMLDWANSPFVALFFAFENQSENDRSKHRAVYALAHHIIQGKKQRDDPSVPRPFSSKYHGNFRLINQGGIFLRMPDPDYDVKNIKHVDLETYVNEIFSNETYRNAPDCNKPENREPRAVLQKFIIPNTDRVECLRFLDHMNINRASLFPDLDGAAQYVNALWEVNFDKAIGHINRL